MPANKLPPADQGAAGHSEWRFSILKAESDPRFEAFYRIYAASIPIHEQKPRTQITAMVESCNYQVWLAELPVHTAELPQTLGLAVLFAPPEESYCLLEFLAVDSAYRSCSIGGQLFLHGVKQALAGRPEVPMIIEVDSEGPADEGQALRQRRQRFYQRLGCRRILDCPYVLPLPGAGAPPPMDLWVYFLEPPEAIGREVLAGWLRGIYDRVYSCSREDERIAEMLRRVPDPVRLL